MNKKILIILISIFSLLSLYAEGTKEVELSNVDELIESVLNGSADELVGASAALEKEDFTLEEMLQYALEDERLALAEYKLILEEFEVNRPFTNIVKAEKSHERAILRLYHSYGFEIKDFDTKDHIVIPNTLEEIYDIGVEAEIANIAMYDNFLAYDLPRNVRIVFESLKKGSISHLKAFQRQASKY